MVLCKFFLQGSCRYGSKCFNEHLDIKQMIKTDVEGAINRKQWPLSTYGPFKDRPSIPNFIEDQSFEEVRMLCYEAKQKNFFDQFHQQFNKEALEANNKMKALLRMTPDVVDVLVSLYDNSPNCTSNLEQKTNVTNPFGMPSSTATNSGGSIFAKPVSNSTASNNLFVNNNAFSGTAQGASNIFSTGPAFASQQQQQQNSLFSQQTSQGGSIFAVGSNSDAQQNTKLFASFSTSTQQQPTAAATGLFSQQNQFLQQPNQSSNIFSQTTQTSQSQQGLFAQEAQTPQQQATQQQQGFFAQSTPPAPAGQGIFAQASQQTQNMFSQAFQQQQQANTNIFQQIVPNSDPQQQQTNANIFQQNQAIAPQQQIQQPPSGFFQQAAMQTHNANQSTQDKCSKYSRLEDLTADEIEAFKGDCFLPGKIPFNPPPRELIN